MAGDITHTLQWGIEGTSSVCRTFLPCITAGRLIVLTVWRQMPFCSTFCHQSKTAHSSQGGGVPGRSINMIETTWKQSSSSAIITNRLITFITWPSMFSVLCRVESEASFSMFTHVVRCSRGTPPPLFSQQLAWMRSACLSQTLATASTSSL
jgi:hypothetical protein